MKFLFVLLFVVFQTVDIDKQYDNSNLIVSARVYDVRNIEGRYIANVQVTKIYKGKRLKNALIKLENQKVVRNRIYLFYLSHIKNSSLFSLNRIVNQDNKLYQDEINYITKKTDKTFFKTVKNPEPKHPIRLDCGCD